MHKIRLPLGLRHRPRWGTYSAPPDPLGAGVFKVREGRGEGEGMGREGR